MPLYFACPPRASNRPRPVAPRAPWWFGLACCTRLARFTRLACCVGSACLAGAGGASAAGAAEPAGVRPFLQKHCHDCHAGGDAEGGLDLTKLALDFDDPALFAKWERLHDRVVAGEMPPPSVDAPPPAERAAFVAALGERLSAAHAARKQTVLRRLNRREYENTLNDLFGANLALAVRLPEDGRAHEFDNVGEALSVSPVQMRRYLECIEAVLDDALAPAIGPPLAAVTRAGYADTRGAEQWLGKIWLRRDDGAVVFFKEFGYPSGMLREAHAERAGWYKIRVRGYAFQSRQPITFSVGAVTFAPGAEQPTFGYFAFPPGEPTTIELRAWLPARYMLSITPWGLFDRDNEIRQKGVSGYAGPGLAIQYVELEGPLVEEFPGRGQRLVYDGLNRVEKPPRNPADRARRGYVPTFEIVSADPRGDAARVLTRVAARAFRRPVSGPEAAPYVDLFAAEQKRGASFDVALRAAAAAIFCAPDFLYLRERPRAPADSSVPADSSAAAAVASYWLDDHALAARLSYFLTRTCPDDALRAAADAGQLGGDGAALRDHAERLLADPRSARFVADFTDAWLNLREIEFTNPDEGLYPEFDRFLQWSMVEETRAYFRKMLDDNLGAAHVARSDFAMLNNRLAEHYGLPPTPGPEIRPVKLPADSPRGGLLGQASVLKVSANGTNTSPVVRGVYVLERVLGQAPPPPPPGVPGVEPDIRGATTLRELLAKHRNLDSCRGCHQMIDPPGFALESFDPVGGWRERFRVEGGGERAPAEVRGQRVRYKLGPPVDASGELADGRRFAGYLEFRAMLAAEKRTLARTLVVKLLTFATGREMGFSDRPVIDRIVNDAAASEYGARDLLRLAVSSEIFRRK